MFVKKMVLYIVDTIRFIRTDLDALLLDTGLANPSSDHIATLSFLDVVAGTPDPRASVLCAFAPEIPREEAKNKSLVLVGRQRHNKVALEDGCGR